VSVTLYRPAVGNRKMAKSGRPSAQHLRLSLLHCRIPSFSACSRAGLHLLRHGTPAPGIFTPEMLLILGRSCNVHNCW
jgi:hypothetical protein